MDHQRIDHLARIVEHAIEWVPQEVATELLAEVRRLRGLMLGVAFHLSTHAELLARSVEKEAP